MQRAGLVMLCLCGAAAQDVQVNNVPLVKIAASSALADAGVPFGAAGTIVPGSAPWLAVDSDADYFHVPGLTSAHELQFIPAGAGATARGASTLTHSGSAPEKACGMGWAKLEHEDGENKCFTEIDGLPPKNWGWTNRIQAGQDFHHTTIPVYIGAAQCQGGHHRFDIAVKYDNEANKITVNLTPVEGYELRAAHVYVGKDWLPKSKNGAYSNSPGGFPVFVNVNDSPVVTFDTDGSGEDYWFAVHVNVCPGKDKDAPTPPPSCPNTFYLAHYYCSDTACTDQAGTIPAQLAAQGWEEVSCPGPKFQTADTTFPHGTKVIAKSLTEAVAVSPNGGDDLYLGVFATGCGGSVGTCGGGPPPPSGGGPPSNGGPARQCAEYCPPLTGQYFFSGAQ